MTNVYLLSLGCDKNKVDGEVMLGQLLAGGFTPVDEPGDADAIIVNTCGFIREAVQESIDLILEMAAYKEGRCKALVVTGCMTERYRDEMAGEIPEVDAVLGVADRSKIVEVLEGFVKQKPSRREGVSPIQYRLLARKNTLHPHIAYVKIAEGCDNRCAYCTIPAIRGGYKSRPMAEIMEECKALVEDGVRELILVAQDTALYGMDLYGEPRLAVLLRELDANFRENFSNVVWIRILYAYPEHITPDLICAIAELPSVCKYLDMPIQHSEDTVLKRMGRNGSRDALKDLIRRLREQIPGIALRTTLMVGFPGETVKEFNSLFNFIKEMQFDRLGVFPYSQEGGTPAATMPKQVRKETKQIRRDRIMALQQEIHMREQQKKVGIPLTVIVDEPVTGGIPLTKLHAKRLSEEGDIPPGTGDYNYIGRPQSDAPEVDAIIRFTSQTNLTPGQMVTVLPTDSDEYDLQGVFTHEPAE